MSRNPVLNCYRPKDSKGLGKWETETQDIWVWFDQTDAGRQDFM